MFLLNEESNNAINDVIEHYKEFQVNYYCGSNDICTDCDNSCKYDCEGGCDDACKLGAAGSID